MIKINKPYRIIAVNRGSMKTTSAPYTVFRVGCPYKIGDSWIRTVVSVFVNTEIEGEKGDEIIISKITGVNVKAADRDGHKYETTLYVDADDIKVERQAASVQGFVEGWGESTDEMPF